jgi:hypothetical protein
MKTALRLLFYIILNITYLSFMAWIVYAVWTHKIPFFWIFLFLTLFFRLPSVLTAYSRYAVEDDQYFLSLAIKSNIPSMITPDFITDVIHQENVINTILNDLRKTRQIGYSEEWRLGLITPDNDLHNPNGYSKIRLKRTAVLNSTDYFKRNNIAVRNGVVMPLGQPKWTYGLETKLNHGEFIDIRNIRMENDSSITEHRSRLFPGFLREDGFPIRDTYPDGDPLTTDRGGTIVMNKDKLIVIYPRYFVQRRLIDDDGNLVDLGIDEDLSQNTNFEVELRPSVSRLLLQRTSRRGYIPVVRYRSYPYMSDYILPILDTPMSASGWADLFIDLRGKGKLFISMEKTETEWYEMMAKLKQLLDDVLAKRNYHLLGLTKDKTLLNYYLARKMDVLKDYYLIQDWQMP